MKKTFAIILFAVLLLGARNYIQQHSQLLTATVNQTISATSTAQVLPAPAPQPPVEIKVTHLATPEILKGLYVTFYSFESKRKFSEIEGVTERNGVNSLIIDVNSDGGPLFDFKDDTIKQSLANLHSKNIYLIARVVAFKISDTKWYEPSSQERWQQLASISKRAIDLGFDEINFDYVRYGGPSEASSSVPIEQRRPNILAFFEFLNKEVRQKYGRPISADVFGVTFVDPQAQIGQNMEDAVKNFDYIMPMPYPSHWALGSFNISHPGNAPYQTVYQALTTGWEKVATSTERIAQLRSWIQAFGIESITPWKLRTYTGKDVQDQIRACDDAGCVGWALWNGNSTYPDSYFQVPASSTTSTVQ